MHICPLFHGVVGKLATLRTPTSSIPSFLRKLQPLYQSTMGNLFTTTTTTTTTTNAAIASKKIQSNPIDTTFSLPSPLPSWPPVGGFAKGSIDLGGIEVCPVSTFTKVWATHQGGPGDLGATFFSPSAIPTGYYLLGSYAQPNNRPLSGWVLVARDTGDGAALAAPVDYTLVWSSASSGVNQDGHGYFWLPIPPEGYKAVGHIVTDSPIKPHLDNVGCVRADLAANCEEDSWTWGSNDDGINVYNLRPSERGTQALGVMVGTYILQTNNSSTATSISCLKNKASNFSSMPNLLQINTLVQAYSPLIYFHPNEAFLPSSLTWFFTNGALLYEKGSQTPSPIDPTGSNLPQGGSNDGAYWIDLPDSDKERIKRGDISSAEAYIHIKPMLGATFTDIAIWLFYPFNGPVQAKVEFFNVSLGKIGEHVGDWEHVTLRVSNLDGKIWKVFFSQHSGGTWMDASELEFAERSNKPVVYASLHGHASYPKAGLVLQGNSRIGIRNDMAKGKNSMDVGAKFQVVAADYLESKDNNDIYLNDTGGTVVAPPWLDYMREWGPKISYDIDKEIKGVGRFLPRRLRRALEDLVSKLPAEVLGEEGPTGPKGKDSWSMDEKVDS